MPFAAAVSTATPTPQAVAEICSQVQSRLQSSPDLAMVFFSVHHAGLAEAIGGAVRERLSPKCLLGCVGEAIVGNEREVEGEPALSVWAGQWQPAIKLEPFHLALERTSEGISLLGWPDGLVEAEPGQSAVLLLGDPFTLPVDLFLQQMNEGHAGIPVLGGMASGIRSSGQCRLLLNEALYEAGGAGVLLHGRLGLRTIVSQGCRPIGRHMVITRAEDNIIFELGGNPPMQQLKDLWETLIPEEQRLFQQGLHVGRVLNEYGGDFQRGDFLVRNVIGLDRSTGALAITERVRVGQTIQFQVRDAATADEDLHALLQLDLQAHNKQPAAALLFTCNGRGTRLFHQPNHDAATIRAEAGAIPVAGFFAQGELGPVGRQNFLHGFTASLALFEE